MAAALTWRCWRRTEFASEMPQPCQNRSWTFKTSKYRTGSMQTMICCFLSSFSERLCHHHLLNCLQRLLPVHHTHLGCRSLLLAQCIINSTHPHACFAVLATSFAHAIARRRAKSRVLARAYQRSLPPPIVRDCQLHQRKAGRLCSAVCAPQRLRRLNCDWRRKPGGQLQPLGAATSFRPVTVPL